jgi:hypothetical protein
MNLPRLLSSEHEHKLLRRYAETYDRHEDHISESAVFERYQTCLLMTVIVAVGMNTVPGVSDQTWSFLFTNALQSALDHNAMELLG